MGSFSNAVLDHFYHPRNAGVAEGFTRRYLEQDNPWRIRIEFTARVREDRIEELKFRTQSCVTTTACCSALTELVQGRTVEESLAITPEQLSEYLGTIPAEKMYCAQLSVATFRKALASSPPASPAAQSKKGSAS